MDANHHVAAGKNLHQRKAFCPRCRHAMGMLDLMCYECGFSFPSEHIALSTYPAVRRRYTPPSVRRYLFWVVAVEFIVVWATCLAAAGKFKPHICCLPPSRDERFIEVASLSMDLERDKKSMWRARCNHLCAVGFSPPISAVNAANRVFSTAYLIGLTREEVSLYLEEPPSRLQRAEQDDSRQYVFFTFVGDEAIGWRFTLHFGVDGRVSDISRAPY